MRKSPSTKLLEVFISIIHHWRVAPSRIRIHWHFNEWEAVAVCRSRRGMRIFVLIISQVVRIHFSECNSHGSMPPQERIGLKLFEYIMITMNHTMIFNGRLFAISTHYHPLVSYLLVVPTSFNKAIITTTVMVGTKSNIRLLTSDKYGTCSVLFSRPEVGR